jgi:hypothetical protein
MGPKFQSGAFVLAKPEHNQQMRFLFAVLLIAFPLPALAWDSAGHEIIATMAYDRLNPKARAAVDELAPEVPNPERVYTGVTLACWMDDLRAQNPLLPNHGRFLSWHYIDIGLDPGDPAPSFEPGDDTDVHGNVVQALKRATAVLKGGTDPYISSKAMACAMVEHLVGDIHQPLHCATKYFVSGGQERNDKGGNDEVVINGPPSTNPRYKSTLHSFWDQAWRASFDEASGQVVLDPRFHWSTGQDPALLRAMATELKKQPPPASADLAPNFDQWARDGNDIARSFVYHDLPATENEKVCRLSSAYVAKANAIARDRLVLAAWRLAALLNGTLGS